MESPPLVNPPNAPPPAPYLIDGMSYKERHSLRQKRGYSHRDARSPLFTLLLTLGQIERKRALNDPEAEPSMATTRSAMAFFDSAFMSDKEVVEHLGLWRGPVIGNSWSAPPSPPVTGVDAAISASTADLRGKYLGKELPQERNDTTRPGGNMRAGWRMRPGENLSHKLAALREFDAFRPVAQSTIEKTIAVSRWVKHRGFADSRWRKHVGEGSLSGQWPPGSGPSTGLSGHRGVREPPLVASAAASFLRPEKMGSMGFEYLRCLP